LKKTRNVGAVDRESYKSTGTLHARQVLLEKAHRIWKRFRDARFSWKRYGIRERLVAGHMNLQSQGTQEAFYLRKHKESGGVGTARIFHWKTQRFLRGLAGVRYKFTVKMKPRRILHEKTQRFLRGDKEKIFHACPRQPIILECRLFPGSPKAKLCPRVVGNPLPRWWFQGVFWCSP